MKEEPIIEDKAEALERYQKAVREAMESVQNPYQTQKHRDALAYLKKRKIPIWSLRK